MARAPLGEGDHHQTDYVLRDLSTRGPFIRALILLEAAIFEIQRGMNERRIRRMLGHSAQ